MRRLLFAAVLLAALAAFSLLRSGGGFRRAEPALIQEGARAGSRFVASDVESLSIPASAVQESAAGAVASRADVPSAEPRFVVRVLDQAGEPISRATVYGEKMSRESVRELGRTGADGQATFAQEHFPVKGQSLFAASPSGRSTRRGHAGSVDPWPGPVVLRVPLPPSESGAHGVVIAANDGSAIRGASIALHPAPHVRADGAMAGALDTSLAPVKTGAEACLLYTSPSPRDRTRSRMPSSA